MSLRRVLFLIPVLVFLIPCSVRGTEYLQVAGLIDLRTTHSDGELDIESLVKLAKGKGFSLLFINDHDRLAMEYGLFPLRNILRKRVERNSINKGGAEKYLNGIRRVQEKYPDMIIIPGSETAPFYFWTGSYFGKNLTAHNHERRILTIGLEAPDDYRDLPILHNGFSTRYIKGSLPTILLFSVSLVLGLWLVKWKGVFRVSGIVVAGLALLFVIDTAAFRSSPFDQYHGDHGIAPYQLLIDYVNSRGGMTFWNYPETRSGTRKMEPIFVDTPPYPEVLEQSKGYTGFAALYGDRITVTEPGDVWDRVLLEYCKGERNQPVWGISTADFHKDGEAGEKLGNFPTVFFVQRKTKEDVLSGMRQGRMYACQGDYPQRMILNDFSVCLSECETKAISGDEVILKENPRIHFSLSLEQPADKRMTVRLIRSGKLIKTFHGSLPMEIDYEDTYFEPGQKIYYRIDVRGCGTLVSNPIFVTFRQGT
jgi:hypothetical protein